MLAWPVLGECTGEHQYRYDSYLTATVEFWHVSSASAPNQPSNQDRLCCVILIFQREAELAIARLPGSPCHSLQRLLLYITWSASAASEQYPSGQQDF